MEKNLGQRWVVIALVTLIGFVLLWPPEQKLRPGLDIAGGTSLIFEVDDRDTGSRANLAEDVKRLLQKRVDPSGVYNLTWRVQGRNRIEVQMPLPPKDAVARRQAYAAALEQLYAKELRRGQVEEALRLPAEQRDAALEKLARGNADAALAATPGAQAQITNVIDERRRLLQAVAQRYDAYGAAKAASDRGPVETPSDTTTAPTTPPQTAEALAAALRDATELFEDAMQEVLGTNLNRRRFEEMLELEAKSKVRERSLAQILERHADLRPEIENAVTRFNEYRQGKRFLDGPADLKRLLRGAGRLEFRILADPDPGNPTKYDRYREYLKEGRERPPGDYGWFRVDNPVQFFNLDSEADLARFKPEASTSFVVGQLEDNYYVLAKISPDDGLLQDAKTQRKWRLNRARIDRDEHGRLSVSFELDVVGGQLFSELTRRNIDKPLCILVDDIAYSAPNIKSEIRTHGQITGEFSMEKVSYLVQTMEGGTLPARLKDTPLAERTIGSSLGEVNRASAVNAGLLAILAVVVVMIGYYWVCGAVANISMILNVFLTLAALAMLSARITLDGIAGMILAVGMAVDANVLIYERMREEKTRGSSLRMVVKNGYDKAFRTIFDSNMTTLLTCLIIYYVGSEEVKGFGLTLGWGIVLNLFTSVFVSRAIFDLLLKLNLIKDIKMMSLIPVPNIDWHSKFKFFMPVSICVIVLGLLLMYSRGTREMLDVEFLGGVTAEVELKQANLNDRTIAQRLDQVGNQIAGQDAPRVAQATATAVPGEINVFSLQVDGVSGRRLAAMLAEPLESKDLVKAGGVAVLPGTDQVQIVATGEVTAEQLTQAIREVGNGLQAEAKKFGAASVNAVLETGGVTERGLVWAVTTVVTNMRLVEHVLASALGDEMRIQPRIEYVLEGRDGTAFPITARLLSEVVPGLPADVNADLTDYLGGAAICLTHVTPPLSAEALRERLENTHFQPDFAGLPKRDFRVIGISPVAGQADERGNPLHSALVIATFDPDHRYADDPELWRTGFADQELSLAKTALSKEQTLRKVMQFKPQIAARSSQQAAMALLLAWAMIIAYVWIRFGGLSYGIGGVIALVHDVLIALVFVGISGWFGGLNHPIGEALLIEDFKINMPVIAALLTIIGFSINDTIVIYDRVRELRGRLAIVTPQVVNAAVNECMSRTVLTTFTVLTVVVIAYVFGGSSIRGFCFTFLIGCLSGTYTTIVLAPAFLLFRLRREPAPALAPVPAR